MLNWKCKHWNIENRFVCRIEIEKQNWKRREQNQKNKTKQKNQSKSKNNWYIICKENVWIMEKMSPFSFSILIIRFYLRNFPFFSLSSNLMMHDLCFYFSLCLFVVFDFPTKQQQENSYLCNNNWWRTIAILMMMIMEILDNIKTAHISIHKVRNMSK